MELANLGVIFEIGSHMLLLLYLSVYWIATILICLQSQPESISKNVLESLKIEN